LHTGPPLLGGRRGAPRAAHPRRLGASRAARRTNRPLLLPLLLLLLLLLLLRLLLLLLPLHSHSSAGRLGADHSRHIKVVGCGLWVVGCGLWL
jgi:hypothetical protein